MLEPFVGLNYPLSDKIIISVLGPDKEYYKQILGDFDVTAQKSEYSAKNLRGFLARAKIWVQEAWDTDSIRDGEVTSAKNNSSAVLCVAIDKDNFLFTADAGIESLSRVADYLQNSRLTLIRHNIERCKYRITEVLITLGQSC